MVRKLGEFLDQELAEQKKLLNSNQKRIQRIAKDLVKSLETGKMTRIQTDLTDMEELCLVQKELCGELISKIKAFDLSAYFSYHFHEELLEACRQEHIMIEGTFPTYEVFPFKVQIMADQKMAVINNLKTHGLKPAALAAEIKKERDRLYSQPFNARSFLRDLAKVYDALCIQKTGRKETRPVGITFPIKKVYAALTPLRRFSREYPLRFFAFDIHRLIQSGELELEGRRCHFGSSRDPRRAIRIIDTGGRDLHIGSLSFRAAE